MKWAMTGFAVASVAGGTLLAAATHSMSFIGWMQSVGLVAVGLGVWLFVAFCAYKAVGQW